MKRTLIVVLVLTNIASLALAIIAFTHTADRGPVGPQGPRGAQGAQGTPGLQVLAPVGDAGKPDGLDRTMLHFGQDNYCPVRARYAGATGGTCTELQELWYMLQQKGIL